MPWFNAYAIGLNFSEDEFWSSSTFPTDPTRNDLHNCKWKQNSIIRLCSCADELTGHSTTIALKLGQSILSQSVASINMLFHILLPAPAATNQIMNNLRPEFSFAPRITNKNQQLTGFVGGQRMMRERESIGCELLQHDDEDKQLVKMVKW